MALDFPTAVTNNTYFRGPPGGQTWRADGSKWRQMGGWERINYYPPVSNSNTVTIAFPDDVKVFKVSVFGMCPMTDDYIHARVSVDGGGSYVYGSPYYRYMAMMGGAGTAITQFGDAASGQAQFIFSAKTVIANSTYPNYFTLLMYPGSSATQFQWRMYVHATTVGPLYVQGWGYYAAFNRITNLWFLANYNLCHRGITVEGIRRGD